jgi:hypothetical protein
MLNDKHINKGKQPTSEYKFITPEVWEAFVQEQTRELRSKGQG